MLRKLQEHREDGQAIVFVAAAILGMLAFLGLAVDGGNVYLQRRNAQNAADAAAQAGTVALAQNYSKPDAQQNLTEAGLCAIMKDYGTVRNPSDPAQFIAMYAYRGAMINCTSTAPVKPYEESLGTRAIAGINADSYISQIFGRSSFKVTANATVQYGSPDTIVNGGAFPVTLKKDWLDGKVDYAGRPQNPARPVYDVNNPNDANNPNSVPASQKFKIWDDDKSVPGAGNEIGGGNRGWINPSCKYNRDLGDENCSQSNANLKDWVLNGYNGEVAIGDELLVTPGVRASSLHETQDRIDAGRPIVTIPVFDTVRGVGGKDYVTIVGFAMFRLTGVVSKGSDKGVEGYFVNYVTAGEMGPAGTPNHGVVVVQPTG